MPPEVRHRRRRLDYLKRHGRRETVYRVRTVRLPW
jgi:hypothetical protein